MTNKKINNYFEQESGRSMVEMLGVLAIIGVLSVGGISGYTTAMNKHKANEILNAAAVRAMAVSTQLQNGAETPSLGEFTGTSSVGGVTFDDEGTITSSGGKFTIGFTNNGKPSEAVLKQMEQIAGTDGIVRAITAGGLTYNDDLSTDARPSDYNGETDPEGEKCTTANFKWCDELNQCIAADGTCGTCANTYTGSTTTGGTKIGNTNCYCPSGTELQNGKCESTGPVFKVLRNGTHDESYTHSEAQADCAELGAGWRLASGADIGCGYGDSCSSKLSKTSLTYTSDADAWNNEFIWLSDCCEWDIGYTTCSNTKDGSPVTCPSGDSGTAWYVYHLGSVGDLDRGDLNFALCVKDS